MIRNFRRFWDHRTVFLGGFLLFSGALFFYSWYEYRHSQQDLLQLLNRHLHTTLEIMAAASENTIWGNVLLEEEVEKRMLAASRYVYALLRQDSVRKDNLERIVRNFGLFRLVIADRRGAILISSSQGKPMEQVPEEIQEIIRHFLSGREEYTTTYYHGMVREEQYRYAMIYRLDSEKVLITSIDARELLDFRKKTGFGSLVRRIAENRDVVYVVVQDTAGILAASAGVREMNSISEDSVLVKALKNAEFVTRFSTFGEQEIIEAIHPLVIDGETIGLFRIGISMAVLEQVRQAGMRRFLLSTVVFLVFGTILGMALIIYQRFHVIRKQYQEVETFSQNILQNLSEGVLILDEQQHILMINRYLAGVLGMIPDQAAGKRLEEMVSPEVRSVLLDGEGVEERAVRIGAKEFFWLVSRLHIKMENGHYRILVVKDITQQRFLMEQVSRRERLSAMGQLASGVAHEIRNPLNSIATLVQQLKADFTVLEGQEEYHQLMEIVLKEIQRLNNIVESFLRLSRPDPLHLTVFELNQLFQEICQQYESYAERKKIRLTCICDGRISVEWDRDKIRQVLINLINNALDAIEGEGEIAVHAGMDGTNFVKMTVRDSGRGIPSEHLTRIFDAYFTTRPEGTGLGLSIVQQVVDMHCGTIDVGSTPGKGTEFSLRIPAKVVMMGEMHDGNAYSDH